MINPFLTIVAPVFAGLMLPYSYRNVKRYSKLLLQLLFLADIVILSVAAAETSSTPLIIFAGTVKNGITASFLFSKTNIYILMMLNFSGILLTLFIQGVKGEIEPLHEKIITLLPLFIGNASILITSADRIMLFASYDVMLLILLSVYFNFSSYIGLRRQYSIVSAFSLSSLFMGLSAGTGIVSGSSLLNASAQGISQIFMYISVVIMIPVLFRVTNMLASKKYNFILFTFMMLVIYVLVYILYRYPIRYSVWGAVLMAVTGGLMAVTGALFSVFKRNTWERILYLSMTDAGYAVFMLSSSSPSLGESVMNSFTFFIIMDVIMVIVMGRLEINEKYSKIMFRSFPLATVVMISAVMMRLFIPPFPGFASAYPVIRECFSSGMGSFAVFTIFISSLQLTIFFRILRDILKNMDEIYYIDRKEESGGWSLMMILAVMIFMTASPFEIMKNPFGNDHDDSNKAYMKLYRSEKAEKIADVKNERKFIIGE